MSLIRSFQYHFNVHFMGRALLRINRWRNEIRADSSRRVRRDYLAPPLKIAPRMKELVARHWLQGRYANLHDKVAWVTSGAPVELLKALDYYVLYPENHAAICGTARVAQKISAEAEKAGYSSDICPARRRWAVFRNPTCCWHAQTSAKRCCPGTGYWPSISGSR